MRFCILGNAFLHFRKCILHDKEVEDKWENWVIGGLVESGARLVHEKGASPLSEVKLCSLTFSALHLVLFSIRCNNCQGQVISASISDSSTTEKKF